MRNQIPGDLVRTRWRSSSTASKWVVTLCTVGGGGFDEGLAPGGLYTYRLQLTRLMPV